MGYWLSSTGLSGSYTIFLASDHWNYSLQNQTVASNTNYNGGGNDPSPPRPSPPKERPDETTKLNGTNDEVEVSLNLLNLENLYLQADAHVGNEPITALQAAWNVTNAIQGMFIVGLPIAVKVWTSQITPKRFPEWSWLIAPLLFRWVVGGQWGQWWELPISVIGPVCCLLNVSMIRERRYDSAIEMLVIIHRSYEE